VKALDTWVFVSYGLAALLAATFGLVYLVRPRFMPYHQEALGVPWKQVDPRLQALLLGLMRTAGGGLFASALAIAIMLVIPLRAGEAWPRYSIPIVGLATAAPAFYATVLVRNRTGAHPPVLAAAAGIGLIVLGVVLSVI
jgi:hypothetical protein